MTLSLPKEQSVYEEKVAERLKAFPNWTGKTVVCVATGPSLTAGQIDHLSRHDEVRIIAINEAGLRQYLPLAVPWADILYAADARWWQHYRPEFLGLRVSGEVVQDYPTIPLKMLEKGEPVSTTVGEVLSGGHSGFQALNLALTLRAKRILLLGYDNSRRDGYRNCHKNRPEHFLRNVNMNKWNQHYFRVAEVYPDVEIINCSPHTAIRAFPVANIEDVL